MKLTKWKGGLISESLTVMPKGNSLTHTKGGVLSRKFSVFFSQSRKDLDISRKFFNLLSREKLLPSGNVFATCMPFYAHIFDRSLVNRYRVKSVHTHLERNHIKETATSITFAWQKMEWFFTFYPIVESKIISKGEREKKKKHSVILSYLVQAETDTSTHPSITTLRNSIETQAPRFSLLVIWNKLEDTDFLIIL